MIENLNVDTPNFQIGRISPTHHESKSDRDVKSLIIKNSKLTKFPTFDKEYFAGKFRNVKLLLIDGENSTVPLSIEPTVNGRYIIPTNIESFVLW